MNEQASLKAALSLALALAWSGCTTSGVTIAPPRVPQGGRAVAVSVALSDGKRIFVATESGGLFRTFDGGKSFQHLDAFPTFKPIDVAVGSPDPSMILATARDDFRTQSGGGIWRSTDDGGTWKRPAGWPPAQSSTCPDRPVARNISHLPLSPTYAVATDCGIAISNDNGASFSLTVLDPSQPTVRSVLLLDRSAGVAADDQSLWFLNGRTWQRATGGPGSLGFHAFHAMAAPWWASSSIFYHMGRDRLLYFSMDGGASWQQMETPDLPDLNRESFVRVGRGLDGDPTHFDVYYGDGSKLYREAVTTSVPGGHQRDWRQLSSDHSDPADIAFTPGEAEPLMLATDGGVHLTTDQGETWTLTGSGFGGFTALQIGEITGRAVGGDQPHLDLFYGTQDNDIRGSADGGHTWGGSLGGEGAFLRAGAVDPIPTDEPVTGKLCGNCRLFEALPHLGNTSTPPPFHSAPDGNPANRADFPFQVVGSAYIQNVPATGPPASFDYFLTLDRGNGWRPVFSLPEAPVGNVQFAGSLANPTAYVSVRTGSGIGLFRVQDLAATPAVRRADSTGSGFGALGLLHTGQATYSAFAVDPANANHLLAADIGMAAMQASSDGGVTWYPVPPLTTAVTDSGRFLFSQDDASFATVIAWDPTNSCHILVGTLQNGVIRSADGGLTWTRVVGSPIAIPVTSFFFPPTGEIWMSTHGRGLWTISVDRRTPANGRCAFPAPPSPRPKPVPPVAWPIATRRSQPFSGMQDALICSSCTLLAVHNGSITDVTTDGNAVTGIGIDHGILVERGPSGKEAPQSVPNVYSDRGGEGLRRLLGAELANGRRVRALILRDRQVVAYVLSRDELPLPATRTPAIYVASAGRSRIPSVAEVGESVAVHGSGFLPGAKTSGVDVVFDGDTAAMGVNVGADGTFAVRLPVRRGPGLLEVRAVQRDGRRLTVARASITVSGSDGR
jgi:hypothetical protein